MLHVRKARAVPWFEELIRDADSVLQNRLQPSPFQQWHQGTRRVLAAVFGPQSEQVAAYDKIAIASFNIGAFESTELLQKREDGVRLVRDRLRDWLASDIARAPDDEPIPKPPTVAEAQYAVLGVLFNLQEEHAGKAWAAPPGADFDNTGITDDREQRKALEALVFRNFAKRIGGGYTLTATGQQAYADRKYFFSLFPGSKPDDQMAEGRATTEAGKVGKIRDDLAFMRAGKLRGRVVEDVAELAIAVEECMYKSQMMLCGSILEAVLYDVLVRRPDIAATLAPNFPQRWSLRHYLDAASTPLGNASTSFLSPSSTDFGRRVTEHRDLIHAYAYDAGSIVIDDAVAGLMVSLLITVVRDLRRAHETGVIKAFEST